MDIDRYIKEAHENAVEKGFYECPECGGECNWYGMAPHSHDLSSGSFLGSTRIMGEYPNNFSPDQEPIDENGIAHQGTWTCSKCHGTGIDPNKNIGELLMLIVSELGEALEAHRKGRLAELENYLKDEKLHGFDRVSFEYFIKDTLCDELADAKIRCFDLMGYLNIDFQTIQIEPITWKSDNVAQKIRQVCKYFDNLDEDNLTNYDMIAGCNYIDQLAESLNIDLERFIKAKNSYNKTRPYKHGKLY